MHWIVLWVIAALCAAFWPSSAVGGHGAIGASMVAALCVLVGVVVLVLVIFYGVTS